MQEAIRQSQRRQAAYLEAWMHQGAWPMSRHARLRLERQLVRQARREDWTRRRGPAWAPAIVFVSLGLWFLSMSAHAADPTRWLGVAFILGAIALVMRRRSRRDEDPTPNQEERVPAAESPPLSTKQSQANKVGEVDRTEALCDKLIQEVRASPRALLNIVHKPEETVVSLRKACAALREREQAVRALVTPEDNERLETERRELTTRIESERDSVVRERLSSALHSLEDQMRQRANLVTSAERLGAERTRIHYALENLYTQVLAVKSADSASTDVAGSGLRQSLARLSDEVSAVAESLEATSREEALLPAPVSPVTSEPDPSFPKQADREKS
ncbi:MAG TPA: hypothetical protein VFV14_11680 [Myxococcaceae bacterium]|nr:hypothetical protein [Myxococcaceae bacterium]